MKLPVESKDMALILLAFIASVLLGFQAAAKPCGAMVVDVVVLAVVVDVVVLLVDPPQPAIKSGITIMRTASTKAAP